MLRSTTRSAHVLLGPAAVIVAALVSGGCITPAVVTNVDSDLPVRQPAEAEQVGTIALRELTLEALLSGAEEAVARQNSPIAQQPAETATDAIPRAAIITARIEAAAPPVSPEAQPLIEPLPAAPAPVRTEAPLQQTSQPDGQLSNVPRFKPIQEISLDITPPALFDEMRQRIEPPHDYAAEALPALAAQQPFTRGDLAAAGYEWHPDPVGLTFCYQPLYFEEVNIERYGRSFGMLQPVVSMVDFYGRIPLLPYMAFAKPTRRCTYPGHWTLPGYRIPEWEPHTIIPSLPGAAAEVATLYGIILLIP
jgi:hypothetical protein